MSLFASSFIYVVCGEHEGEKKMRGGKIIKQLLWQTTHKIQSSKHMISRRFSGTSSDYSSWLFPYNTSEDYRVCVCARACVCACMNRSIRCPGACCDVPRGVGHKTYWGVLSCILSVYLRNLLCCRVNVQLLTMRIIPSGRERLARRLMKRVFLAATTPCPIPRKQLRN